MWNIDESKLLSNSPCFSLKLKYVRKSIVIASVTEIKPVGRDTAEKESTRLQKKMEEVTGGCSTSRRLEREDATQSIL